jgi:hypothetical protein
MYSTLEIGETAYDIPNEQFPGANENTPSADHRLISKNFSKWFAFHYQKRTICICQV